MVLPELLDRIGARKPILVGHSDGASIALIRAGNRAVGGVVLLAPHVFVEEITLAAIRETRERYRTGDLRERMVRHHDDPDATFSGWCDVWLDPAFRTWTIESEAEGITAPVQLIQGSDDPYGSLDQTDRIDARVRPRWSASSCPAGPARTSSIRTPSSPRWPGSCSAWDDGQPSRAVYARAALASGASSAASTISPDWMMSASPSRRLRWCTP